MGRREGGQGNDTIIILIVISSSVMYLSSLRLLLFNCFSSVYAYTYVNFQPELYMIQTNKLDVKPLFASLFSVCCVHI